MIKYNQMSLDEREKIYKMLQNQDSLSKIALVIGRNKSTISRECSRNNSLKLGYLPDRANNLASGRRRRYLSKIEKYPSLKQYVVARLTEDKWSPEMISGRMKMEQDSLRISHEAFINIFIITLVKK